MTEDERRNIGYAVSEKFQMLKNLQDILIRI